MASTSSNQNHDVSNSEASSPDILTVGAYERDNFGDILFWHAAQYFARPLSLRPTAPFPGLVDDVVGAQVARYVDATATHPMVPVWVLGGEVGGTRLHQAFSAYADDAQKANTSATQLSGLPAYASPYMPRETPHPIILNSVGLDGLRTLMGARLGYAVSSLAAARYVSVREVLSSEVLRRLGIPHTLAPDVVHTIRAWHQPLPAPSDYILFQMKGAVLKRWDMAMLASQLISIADGARIVVFVAGTAAGHDSLDQYERLCDAIQAASPQAEVAVHADPDPFAKVNLIANARLWIGTSLHGLILSTSLGVPNVSLELRKLRNYANTWGLIMPVGVEQEGLTGAVPAALSADRLHRSREIAESLAHRAERSVKNAVEAASSATVLSSSSRVAGRGGLGMVARSIIPQLRILR